MKKLYYLLLILISIGSHNNLFGQFDVPTNAKFNIQWHHQPTINNSLESQRAWFLSPRKGQDANVFVTDNALFHRLPSIENNSIRKIYLYDQENHVVNESNISYANIGLPDVNNDIFYHGDKMLTLGFGKHNINNSSLAGVAPNSVIDLCTSDEVPEIKDDEEVTFEDHDVLCVKSLVENILKDGLFDSYDINMTLISHMKDNSNLITYNDNLQTLEFNDVITILPTIFLENTNYNIVESSSNYIISVGCVDSDALTISNYDFDYLDLLTAGVDIEVPDLPVISDGLNSYDTESFIGGCASVAITTGVAAMIISDMKNDVDGQDRAQRAWVKKMMTSTAEKFNNSFDNARTVVNLQDNLISNRYNTLRNNQSGYGLLNAHQSILLTKAFVLDDINYIYTPTTDGMSKKTMGIDKVLFDDEKKFGMALNRHKLSIYSLPNINSRDDINNQGGILEDIIPNHNPTNPNFKFEYMQEISLEGANLNFTNSIGFSAAQVNLPFAQVRRLSADIIVPNPNPDLDEQIRCPSRKWYEKIPFLSTFTYDYQACLNSKVIILENAKHSEADSETQCRNDVNVTYDYEGDPVCPYYDHKKDDTDDSGYKDQYFTLASEDDKEKENYKAGDLIVVRTYKFSDNSKEKFVIWSSSKGIISHEDKFNRLLYQDFLNDISYNEETQINKRNELTDNEYLLSPNGKRKLIHHNGRLAILQLNDQGTPDDTNDDSWEEIKMLTDHQDLAYNAHRLLIRENGSLEFVGGSEVSNGTFTEEALLKTFGSECQIGDLTLSSDITLSWFGDNFLSLDSNNISLYLININIVNALTNHMKMLNLNTFPSNSNELVSLVSSDKSKVSIHDGQTIRVYQFKNDIICLNQPIQSYNLK